MLVDLRLPGLSGLEFTRSVRKDPVTKTAVILAMTAFSGDEVVKAAAEAGFDGFITKPFDRERLTAFLRRNLQSQSEVPPIARAGVAAKPGNQGRAFLEDACGRCRALVHGFDSGFETTRVRRMLRQWTTQAGQLGYGSISLLAQDAAVLLEGLWWDPPFLKKSLNGLLAALEAQGAEDAAFPALAEELNAMRIALARFDVAEVSHRSPLIGKFGKPDRTILVGGKLEHAMKQCCDVELVRAGGAEPG